MAECQFTMHVLFFETNDSDGKSFIIEKLITMDIIAID